MPIFREVPPTAGFPLRLKDIFGIFGREDLENGLKKYLGLEYLKITCSGTAAFYFILEALKEISPKRKVIIPSFACPLLPLAVKRAGFETVICDIKEGSFDFDPEKLEELCRGDEISALLCVHLAGIPVDLAEVKKIAGPKGIFIIEDCAQSLGASLGGRKTGAIGDFSFFSFARGKGLTIYEGGLASALRREHQAILDKKIARLEKAGIFSELLKIAELFGYWAFYRPLLFWFVFRLRQLYWELREKPLRAAGEYFAADFPVHRVSGLRKKVGASQLSRLEEGIKGQREMAAFYAEGLKGVKGISLLQEKPGSIATYPYLTVLFDDPGRRERVLKRLSALGLGASFVYLRAIDGYDYLKDMVPGGDYPGGRSMASRSLTLSTSCFIKRRDAERVAEEIERCMINIEITKRRER